MSTSHSSHQRLHSSCKELHAYTQSVFPWHLLMGPRKPQWWWNKRSVWSHKHKQIECPPLSHSNIKHNIFSRNCQVCLQYTEISLWSLCVPVPSYHNGIWIFKGLTMWYCSSLVELWNEIWNMVNVKCWSWNQFNFDLT